MKGDCAPARLADMLDRGVVSDVLKAKLRSQPYIRKRPLSQAVTNSKLPAT
jgi:hypothetical protein